MRVCLFFGVLAACGGSVSPEGGQPSLLPDGGTRAPDGGRIVKKDAGTDSGVNKKDAGVFTDPVCPNPPPPTTDMQCDLVAQTGCGPDEGCYAYIGYPSGYCDPEVYGSRCAPAGTAGQGELCGGEEGCLPGYSCVISGSGTVCAKQCDFGQTTQCPEGKVCEPTDLPTTGVCL
jgi:hypothetical protein